MLQKGKSVYESVLLPAALTNKQNLALLKLARDGDIKAKEELIGGNLRLVVNVIRKNIGGKIDFDDLASIGTLGLIKAVDKFDLSKPNSFSAYAGKAILNEILLYFRISKRYDMSNQVSLEETYSNSHDNKSTRLIDTIVCDDNAFSEIEDEEISSIVSDKIKLLASRDRKLIELRFGLRGFDRLTQGEVASALGISQAQVCRSEKKAINKLKQYLKDMI